FYGSQKELDLSLNNESPLWETGINSYISQSFFNRSRFNATDFGGTLALTYHGQRTDLGLKTSAAKETVRTTETTNFGQNLGAAQEVNYDIQPSFDYHIGQRTHFLLSGRYINTSYDDSRLIDYQETALTPSFAYDITETHRAALSLQYGYFRADNDDRTRINTLSPFADLTWSPNKRWSTLLCAGANISKERSHSLSDDDWQRDMIYEASLRFKGETNKTELRIVRQNQIYTDGNQSLLTSFILETSHKLNENLTLDGYASHQTSGASGRSSLEHKTKASIGLTYQLFQTVALRGSYEYKIETYNDNSPHVQGNKALLSLLWHPFETEETP
ncbi:MAG: outer membrane beta-barrel protein, partial [Bdellovibrionales bacterium]